MTLKSKRRCANSNGLCNCCVSYHHLFSAFCPSYILKNHTLVHFILHFFTIIVQFLSLVLQFETQWTAAYQVSLSFTISWNLLNSCPLSQWCHPTISSSVIIFSSCLQSFPESRSFPMSQFFASGGQSIGASASVQKLVFIQKSSPVTQLVKYLPNNTGDRRDVGSIPGLGRFPREGNGNPLQYSCLENSMNREAWLTTVYEVAKSQTWLSTHAFL